MSEPFQPPIAVCGKDLQCEHHRVCTVWSGRCTLIPDHAGPCCPVGMLHVYQNATHWVVALSAEDASKVVLEVLGETCDGWCVLHDDSSFTLTVDDGQETRTCREWARDGRGFLGSTEV